MEVAQLIREARLGAGLSQHALAARTGTSQPTISAYERGVKAPTADTLVRLLTATGRRLTTEPLLPSDPWAANEDAIRDRLRAAGRRSLGENLSDGLDMIETVSAFSGAASRSPG